MDPEYTAIIKKRGDWWIGWVEEVPGVNCQERTREELLHALRITLQEAVEFNRQDAIASAGTGYEEREDSFRYMKRTELLKYLRSKGCEFIKKATDTLGGGTPV